MTRQSLQWPAIPFAQWRETCAALHLYSQIVGKYRLARTPWVNHSWHATLYVNARGLSTGMICDGPSGGVEIAFDLVDHAVIATAADGVTARFALEPMTVADFHRRFIDLLEQIGATTRFDGSPNEIPDPVPFVQDTRSRPYDADAVRRFFGALVQIDRVMRQFRTSFLGKVSPVHLFWGSFDMAVTRFSGRDAPRHPGGIPALPDAVTHEAYSHQVSSAGFWPGGGGIEDEAFYSYAYPVPEGFKDQPVLPDAAYFHEGLGEFILPYEAVRTASDPDATLLEFFQSTYDAAATLGDWDRANLECHPGVPLRPRAV
ncbi:DUF5996 family protein [Pelagibacterium sp. 26DY04]|uniref:DUF5996 family protein n=1 Tax=Pelagibacterium sp. 26DY04 TaxID=2967130 RepID=UPI002815DEFB|nr:DUF5996 family protein [Pelagibacterium sp. 26DY04]WMT86407.1 DUF5996 family protein [Pelagibacterium sp. 26DY04]